MLLVAAVYTADIWAINQVAFNGSNYMSPEVAASLTPKEVRQAIWGSKMTLALEVFTLTTEWVAKLCLVILYYRLAQVPLHCMRFPLLTGSSFGLDKLRLFCKLVAAYCVGSFIVVMVLCLTVWCHPIAEYWAVPVRHCKSFFHFEPTIMVRSKDCSVTPMNLLRVKPNLVDLRPVMHVKLLLVTMYFISSNHILLLVILHCTNNRVAQCATYYHHMIFATSMNISSDLLLIAIPIPLIVRVSLPLKRKVVLIGVLCLGFFNVSDIGYTCFPFPFRNAYLSRMHQELISHPSLYQIIATALNRYYNFSNPNDITYINWYVGEVSTAVYAANVPLIWPVVRKIFGLHSWWGDSAHDASTRKSTQVRRRRSPDDSLLDLERTESSAPITNASSRFEPAYRKGFKASVDSSKINFRTDDEILDEYGAYNVNKMPQVLSRDCIELR